MHGSKLYHDKCGVSFVSAVTYKFFRTLVGLNFFTVLDLGHIRAICYNETLDSNFQETMEHYKIVMARFWHQNILSNFLYARLQECVIYPQLKHIVEHWVLFGFPIASLSHKIIGAIYFFELLKKN